jgi:hypothetical protein
MQSTSSNGIKAFYSDVLVYQNFALPAEAVFCYNANVARERECGHAVIAKRGTRDKAFFVIGGIWCKKWL